MIRFSLFSAIIVLICLSACSDDSEHTGPGVETNSIVIGKMLNEDKQPVSGAMVRMYSHNDLEKVTVDSVKSLADGSFKFENVSSGEYHIEASFQDKAAQVPAFTVPEKQTVDVGTLIINVTINLNVTINNLNIIQILNSDGNVQSSGSQATISLPVSKEGEIVYLIEQQEDGSKRLVAYRAEKDGADWILMPVNASQSSAQQLSSHQKTNSSQIQSPSSAEEQSSATGLSSNNQQFPAGSYCARNPDLCGFFTDARDNQQYIWVKIGTQTWMQQNLNYEPSQAKGDALAKSWCYDNQASNCATFGRLYSWATALNISETYEQKSFTQASNPHQGICPQGWHIPTQTEFQTMASYVANKLGKTGKEGNNWTQIGEALRATDAPGSFFAGTDEVGFAGMPAGYRVGQLFNFINDQGDYWTVNELDEYTATVFELWTDETFYQADFEKADAVSVRCLKD